MTMDFSPIASAVAVLPVAGRQLATPTGTATSHPTTSTTGAAPPGHHEEGPAAWGADRAWGLTAEKNHELPVSEAGTTSFTLKGATPAAGFPATKAEATLAARLADGISGYIATRWGRYIAVMATLDAVAQFGDRVDAPSAAGGAE